MEEEGEKEGKKRKEERKRGRYKGTEVEDVYIAFIYHSIGKVTKFSEKRGVNLCMA